MPAATQTKVNTAVKALETEGRVGGYLVVWGDPSRKDLQGEYFTPGTDLALTKDKIKAYKHFANKIWNIARFVLSNTEKDDLKKSDLLSEQDQVLISELNELAKDLTKDMDNYRFYSAAEKIYHYFWHTFCDKIIEDSKKGEVSQATLLEILTDCLKILHPFMPFITEEIYQQLPPPAGGKKQKCLMIEKWIL